MLFRSESDLKKTVEDLKTVDTSDMQAQMKFMDLDVFKKQLEERRKERELSKVETDKMLAELERLKALLDQTPEFKPPAPAQTPRRAAANAIAGKRAALAPGSRAKA